jgi:hypothetical protein
MGRVFDCVVSHPQHGDVPAGVCWLEEAPRRGEVLILHTPSAEAGENTPAFVPLPASFLVVQVVRHGWDASGQDANGLQCVHARTGVFAAKVNKGGAGHIGLTGPKCSGHGTLLHWCGWVVEAGDFDGDFFSLGEAVAECELRDADRCGDHWSRQFFLRGGVVMRCELHAGPLHGLIRAVAVDLPACGY